MIALGSSCFIAIGGGNNGQLGGFRGLLFPGRRVVVGITAIGTTGRFSRRGKPCCWTLIAVVVVVFCPALPRRRVRRVCCFPRG